MERAFKSLCEALPATVAESATVSVERASKSLCDTLPATMVVKESKSLCEALAFKSVIFAYTLKSGFNLTSFHATVLFWWKWLISVNI